MIDDDFKQLMDYENWKKPQSKKILCLLQNAWGDRKLPMIFKPNKFNKSAKRMYDICGEDNVMHFANTTPTVTPTASGKAKAEHDHLRKVLERATHYDILIVCGKQAQEAFEAMTMCEFPISVFIMPHPASRSLTNKLCLNVKFFVERHESFKYVTFKQLPKDNLRVFTFKIIKLR